MYKTHLRLSASSKACSFSGCSSVAPLLTRFVPELRGGDGTSSPPEGIESLGSPMLYLLSLRLCVSHTTHTRFHHVCIIRASLQRLLNYIM